MVIEITTEERALLSDLLALHVFGDPTDATDERYEYLHEVEVGRIGLGLLDKMKGQPR